MQVIFFSQRFDDREQRTDDRELITDNRKPTTENRQQKLFPRMKLIHNLR